MIFRILIEIYTFNMPSSIHIINVSYYMLHKYILDNILFLLEIEIFYIGNLVEDSHS